MTNITTLRFILGDQLNLSHSWFSKTDDKVVYVMAEMKQEATYVTHHIQKLAAFFLAMRKFAETLQSNGHQVRYFRISDKDNPHHIQQVIERLLEETGAHILEYQEPDEYRLDKIFKDLSTQVSVKVNTVSSEHFFTQRKDVEHFFHDRKRVVMEYFYQEMRRKHHILIEGDQPVGGRWNFDQENRGTWNGQPTVPAFPLAATDASQVVDEIKKEGIPFMGDMPDNLLNWPITREDSLLLLDHFSKVLLPYFGTFQDAMHSTEKFIFHSRLSFALNSKMLSPAEVIESVLQVYYKDPQKSGLSNVEGFIRQILGWREYIRGIYWWKMPDYLNENFFGLDGVLPSWYWTGQTRMRCLQHSIQQSLSDAYAHHIQRLMITGNFALLLGTAPREVHLWYLGVYIDAVEWVELPNTLGMSQFADGGFLATKPYVSSANYIDKMSNYCKDCSYNRKTATNEDSCPFNALYWNFLEEHRELLNENPRMGMMYRLLDKKSADEREAIVEKAKLLRSMKDSL